MLDSDLRLVEPARHGQHAEIDVLTVKVREPRRVRVVLAVDVAHPAAQSVVDDGIRCEADREARVLRAEAEVDLVGADAERFVEPTDSFVDPAAKPDVRADGIAVAVRRDRELRARQCSAPGSDAGSLNRT